MTGCFRSTGVSALLIRPPTRIMPSWSTNGSNLYSKLVFSNPRFLFLAWFLFVSPSVTFKSQRIWSSSRKCSYCKHLMMVFSASWSSRSVILSIDFSTSVLDLVTGLAGFLISLLWSLDYRNKHRAMTFIARYQLDTHLVCLFQSDQEMEQHFWPSWSKRTLSSSLGQNLEGVVAPRFLVYRVRFSTRILDQLTKEILQPAALWWVLLMLRLRGCCLWLRKTMRWDRLGPGFAALC